MVLDRWQPTRRLPWRVFRELEETGRQFDSLFETSLWPAIWRRLPAEERELPENVQVYAVALDSALREAQGSFGPELELARALGQAYSEQSVVLVKYAVDASSLLDWAPDWNLEGAQITGNPGYGALYQQLLDLEAWVREEAEPGCQPTAIFWMQGERDARIAEAGHQYQENLTNLIRQRFTPSCRTYSKP